MTQIKILQASNGIEVETIEVPEGEDMNDVANDWLAENSWRWKERTEISEAPHSTGNINVMWVKA